MSNARNLARLLPNASGQLPTGNLQDASVTVAKLNAARPPNYNVSTKSVVGMNTWNQAPSDGVVTIVASGPYMNGLQAYAGVNTSGNYTRICYMGDDINSNTKAQSFSFPIKAGFYYYVAGDGFPGGFENVDITFWPNA